MKMAKPDERDNTSALELASILSALETGQWPPHSHDTEGWTEWFDPDNERHLRQLYDRIHRLMDDAPGFYWRVIGGSGNSVVPALAEALARANFTHEDISQCRAA